MAVKRRSSIHIDPKEKGTLIAMARREGGLTKDRKISKSWARKKLNSPRVRESTKKKIRFFLNLNKSRRKNPITTRQRRQVNKAIRLFKRFREEEPEFIDEIPMEFPKVAMLIGDLDSIFYTTSRGGKVEHYEHKFTGKTKPLLVSSWDGKFIFAVPGTYDFTKDGIKDRK